MVPDLHGLPGGDEQGSVRLPRPGQRMARRAIRQAQALSDQGITVSVHWIPGHTSIQGSEVATVTARDAAGRIGVQTGIGVKNLNGEVSVAWLKKSRTRTAAKEWRMEILARNKGRRTFSLPKEGARPRIPRPL